MNLLKEVILDRAARKKDRTISLTFVTALEQSSEEYMKIDELINTSGAIFYKPSGNLTELELKELDALDMEVNGKTRSQRLRGALMVLHKKSGSIESKEDFYVKYMEKFIKHIVEQIPED